MSSARYKHLVFLLFIAALLVCTFLSCRIGAVQIETDFFIRFFQSTLSGSELSRADQHTLKILWHIRLPRVFASVMVGGTLAVCGVVMQGLFRNPLVDPGIVGVMSGASFAATMAIVMGSVWFPTLFVVAGDFALPIAAFFGGWMMTMFLYLFARRGGILNIASMLLIGIALGALTGALTGLLTYLADDNQLRSISFWSLGSLAIFDWHKAMILSVAVVLCLPFLWRDGRVLNAMMLGENIAGHLGFNVEAAKKRQVFIVALLVGICVAFSGGIGFVGLVVPHIARNLVGAHHQWLIPTSFLCGATLLCGADLIARIIVSPAELPIGILTALIGGPFLGYLVWRRSKL